MLHISRCVWSSCLAAVGNVQCSTSTVKLLLCKSLGVAGGFTANSSLSFSLSLSFWEISSYYNPPPPQLPHSVSVPVLCLTEAILLSKSPLQSSILRTWVNGVSVLNHPGSDRSLWYEFSLLLYSTHLQFLQKDWSLYVPTATGFVVLWYHIHHVIYLFHLRLVSPSRHKIPYWFYIYIYLSSKVNEHLDNYDKFYKKL